jgi:hypothetical protein
VGKEEFFPCSDQTREDLPPYLTVVRRLLGKLFFFSQTKKYGEDWYGAS